MCKKKLVALLLAVAMIASMAVPSVAAESEATSVACPCASCNGAVPTWEEWTFTSGNVTSGGHYR
nr:hypothetical protein [Oscillospiraceae bacterium]